jgi:hypothetical protein
MSRSPVFFKPASFDIILTEKGELFYTQTFLE